MEQKSKRYVDKEGNVWWRLPDGKLHRLDGPAVELVSSTKAWYIDDKFHRLDGPAIEWSSGAKSWYVDNMYHLTFQSYLKVVKPLITEQEYFILVLTYETEK